MPFDLRVWWTGEDREQVSYFVENPTRKDRRLSGGERRARGRFYERVTAGIDPVDALYYAVGLNQGPIPSRQTLEEFQAYWSEGRLSQIASRWLKSTHHRPYSPSFREAIKPDAGKGARKFLQNKALVLAEGLFCDAFNPMLTPAERIRAQGSLLKLPCMNLKVRDKLPITVIPSNLKDIEAAAPALLNEALSHPKAAHAKLVVNLLQWMLAKANPEVYGDRLKVDHSGEINMVAVLADVQERRKQMMRAEVLETVDAPSSQRLEALEPVSSVAGPGKGWRL